MSVTLRKADGDIYINPNTGQGEIASGPTKVSQELFSLYTTPYDPIRGWGSDLSMDKFKNINSMAQFRALLYFRLQQANNRFITKQANDIYLDNDKERIVKFSSATVTVDPGTQGAIFQSVADVGDPTTQVGQTLYMTYKPVSLRQVVPVPVTVLGN